MIKRYRTQLDLSYDKYFYPIIVTSTSYCGIIYCLNNLDKQETFSREKSIYVHAYTIGVLGFTTAKVSLQHCPLEDIMVTDLYCRPGSTLRCRMNSFRASIWWIWREVSATTPVITKGG